VQAKLQSAQIDPANIYVMCPGAEYGPTKRWPTSHFAELAQRLIASNPNNQIILLGSKSDHALAQEIHSQAKQDAHIHNWCGNTSLDEAIALIGTSKAVISNDSGPAHFASTTPIPTYVFFGPETPNLYGALGNFTPIYANFACSPCVSSWNHRKTPCQDNRCLQVISAETVYQKVQKCLV
jgi:heptosyltransferase-2